MHQSVRVLIKATEDDGTRGALVEKSLVDILSLLSGTNLRTAGRTRLDNGDEEFVFSVQHTGNDNKADEKALDLLRAENYEAQLVQVRSFVLDHRGGSLLECIKDLEAELNEPVIEVYVGAAERNNKIPVQLVTRSMLNR
jgi:hypothetical protein